MTVGWHPREDIMLRTRAMESGIVQRNLHSDDARARSHASRPTTHLVPITMASPPSMTQHTCSWCPTPTTWILDFYGPQDGTLHHGPPIAWENRELIPTLLPDYFSCVLLVYIYDDRFRFRSRAPVAGGVTGPPAGSKPREKIANTIRPLG